jgi:TRAP-type mannitol/chloroaromatic compound transport system permease small subunit
MNGAIRCLERLIEWSGRACAWLVLALVCLVVYDVAMRYLFQAGSVALQELEWHLFGIVFLLGAGYTLKHDNHVRVDLLYHSRFMSDRSRNCVNLIGTLLFLIPFCVLIIVSSWDFVADAYRYREQSPDPGGLPYRWLLKACIPAGFFLLIVQGAALALRSIQQIRNRTD